MFCCNVCIRAKEEDKLELANLEPRGGCLVVLSVNLTFCKPLDLFDKWAPVDLRLLNHRSPSPNHCYKYSPTVGQIISNFEVANFIFGNTPAQIVLL